MSGAYREPVSMLSHQLVIHSCVMPHWASLGYGSQEPAQEVMRRACACDSASDRDLGPGLIADRKQLSLDQLIPWSLRIPRCGVAPAETSTRLPRKVVTMPAPG